MRLNHKTQIFKDASAKNFVTIQAKKFVLYFKILHIDLQEINAMQQFNLPNHYVSNLSIAGMLRILLILTTCVYGRKRHPKILPNC